MKPCCSYSVAKTVARCSGSCPEYLRRGNIEAAKVFLEQSVAA
jgi:hypothetical protein